MGKAPAPTPAELEQAARLRDQLELDPEHGMELNEWADWLLGWWPEDGTDGLDGYRERPRSVLFCSASTHDKKLEVLEQRAATGLSLFRPDEYGLVSPLVEEEGGRGRNGAAFRGALQLSMFGADDDEDDCPAPITPWITHQEYWEKWGLPPEREGVFASSAKRKAA